MTKGLLTYLGIGTGALAMCTFIQIVGLEAKTRYLVPVAILIFSVVRDSFITVVPSWHAARRAQDLLYQKIVAVTARASARSVAELLVSIDDGLLTIVDWHGTQGPVVQEIRRIRQKMTSRVRTDESSERYQHAFELTADERQSLIGLAKLLHRP